MACGWTGAASPTRTARSWAPPSPPPRRDQSRRGKRDASHRRRSGTRRPQHRVRARPHARRPRAPARAPVLEPDAACAALDRVQGLVLTGGEDVEPSRYGAPPHPKLGETDPARDAVELALIAGAERQRLPILAICRGIQILNVALGGTLYQDLASERGGGPIDHTDTAARHGLRGEPHSLLHRTLGTVGANVNSRHHQAVRELAPTLHAAAWAEDGVLEGVERVAGASWTLAVPWHPEAD